MYVFIKTTGRKENEAGKFAPLCEDIHSISFHTHTTDGTAKLVDWLTHKPYYIKERRVMFDRNPKIKRKHVPEAY